MLFSTNEQANIPFLYEVVTQMHTANTHRFEVLIIQTSRVILCAPAVS